jgi:predicted GNAT family acetyltransferase
MNETPTVKRNEAAGRFEVTVDGDTAFADYHLDGDVLSLPHTVTPKALEGRGLGSALAKAALDYARENGLAVRPTCSFMAGYIDRHPETQDLLHADFRKG